MNEFSNSSLNVKIKDNTIVGNINDKKLEKKVVPFRVSLSRIFKFNLCFFCLSENDKKEKKLYNSATRFLNQKLDIIHFLWVNEKVEKMSLLIFNEEQNMALNYTKKPCLIKEDELKLHGINLEEENPSRNLEKLNEYFKAKIPDLDNYDKKLIEMLPLNLN